LLDVVRVDRTVGITPQTSSPDEAAQWFQRYEGAGLDGVVAKDPAGVYLHGERRWVKVKHLRTVDCVVGGFRPHVKGVGIGSLLLGLYDGAGVLHHVGHTSGFNAAERREIFERLQPLTGGESFGHGRTPGAPSRWRSAAEATELRRALQVLIDAAEKSRRRSRPPQKQVNRVFPREADAAVDLQRGGGRVPRCVAGKRLGDRRGKCQLVRLMVCGPPGAQ